MNIMFETIGKRDLMGIFLNHTYGTKYRVQIKDDELKNFDYLKPIYDVSYANEPNYKINKNDDLIGYTCPMLFKSLRFMMDHKINMIDHLILIATNRKNIENKLEAIEKILEDEENINTELIDYLQNGIIKYIKTDNTAETADVIKNIITTKKPDFLDISINKVTVLELGTYGYFHSIIEFDLKNMHTLDLISRADINKLDFFEYELYFGLKDMFKTFENANIYLATYAGGMPLMQRALDNILTSVVSQKKVISIYNSEYLTYQIEHNPQAEILSLFRKMNQAVVSLDWDNAKLFYDKIILKYPDYTSKETQDALTKLFNEVDEFRKSNQNWFSNFFTLIMKSLYEQNYNDVVVWVKCLEEAMLNHLFIINTNKLWDEYNEFDPNNKSNPKELNKAFQGYSNKFMYISLKNDNGQKIYCKARINELINMGIVTIDEIKKEFSGYLNCFARIEKNNIFPKKEFNNIRNVRNKLIHQGTSVNSFNGFITTLLKFLNIDATMLNNAIEAINEMNLVKIKNFEKSVLKNKFFSQLTPYIHSQSNDIMKFRNYCDRFFNVLHLV